MTTETQEKVARRGSPPVQQKSGLPPVIVATIQTAVLSAVSNVLAQGLASYRHDKPFVIDWVPVFQFFVFACLNTPPNFAWQMFLEEYFPSYPEQPKQKEGRSTPPSEKPKLSISHTIIKTLMDQTLGAIINTFMFASYTYSIQEAMMHRNQHPVYSKPENSMRFLFSGAAVDYSQVNWDGVMDTVADNFWSIVFAGWKLWPAVSLVNFAFVEKVETRNLVGALAGVAWGIYISLFAAGEN